jgi:hypothetical protein
MTDYKQLCVELVEAWDATADFDYNDFGNAVVEIVDRARAALAEPEPEGPTEAKIASILLAYAVVEPQVGVSRILHEKHFGNAARAVLTRWGNHPGSPNSSMQPIPVSERLPRPEDCDAEGRCWWWYPPVPEQTYGYWAHEDDAVPERAVDEQPSHWLPANVLSQPF